MLARPETASDPRRRVDLDRMALAIVDRERMAIETLAPGPGERGRGVESAGKQDDRFQRRVPCERRCLALAAAGVPGYARIRFSSVFWAAF